MSSYHNWESMLEPEGQLDRAKVAMSLTAEVNKHSASSEHIRSPRNVSSMTLKKSAKDPGLSF